MIKHKNQLITSDKVLKWLNYSFWKCLCLDMQLVQQEGQISGDRERRCASVRTRVRSVGIQQLLGKNTTIAFSQQSFHSIHAGSDRDPPLAPLPVYVPGSHCKWSKCIFMWLLLFITCKMAWDTLMHAISLTMITGTVITQSPAHPSPSLIT